MGREANIDSIQALDKQIEEGKGDLIKLKRTRNSLLNISTRVPPEILGEIFGWSLVLEADPPPDPFGFGHLGEGPHNFLLVCHHWFEIACLTPELWSFWGKTLRDWKRCHRRSRVAPIDLVLGGCERNPWASFDESLRDAVRARVTQGTIRRVHLMSNYGHDLTSIISSLSPNCEGSQNENIESISWREGGPTPVDVSDFFARSRLTKLRLLGLSGRFRISSWDRLAPQTTLLTVLSLRVYKPSPTPTTSQLLSLLASNPNLQRLTLSNAAIPNDADGSTFQVSLPNLKVLTLAGEFHHLFGLLRRLILPEALDEASLTGFESTTDDVSRTLAPYMRDYFQRDTRFQDRLEISPSSSTTTVSISVGVVCAQAAPPTRKPPRVTFTAHLADSPPPHVLKQLFIDFTAPLPRERVVFLKVEDMRIKNLPEELFFMMPNIEMLHLSCAELSKWFLRPNPNGPHADRKLLPSLRSVSLHKVSLNDHNLDRLVKYLTYLTLGGQTISLEVVGYFCGPHMRKKAVDKIKNLVDEFTLDPAPRRWVALQHQI